MSRQTAAALVLVLETALAAYLSIVVWLLSVWMMDDSQAAAMVPLDWYIEALRRLVAAAVIGSVFGGILFLTNRRLAAALFPRSPSLSIGIAWALAACVILAGAVGAVQFVVTKPFM